MIKKHLLTREDDRDVERDDRNEVDHIHAVRDKPGDGERSLVPFYFSPQILTSTSLGRQQV